MRIQDVVMVIKLAFVLMNMFPSVAQWRSKSFSLSKIWIFLMLNPIKLFLKVVERKIATGSFCLTNIGSLIRIEIFSILDS